MSPAVGKIFSPPTASSLLLLSANVMAFAFSFLLPLLLVRFFSVTEYGLFKQAFLFVSMSVYLLPLGYGMSVYYFLPREPAEKHGAIVLSAVCVHGAIGVIVLMTLLIWPGLLALVYGGHELLPHAPLIGVVVLLWSISRLSEIVPVAYGEIPAAMAFIVFGQVGRTILFVLAAAQFHTVRAILFAAILEGVVQVLCFALYLLSRFPRFWKKLDTPLMRDQLVYALPLGIAAVLQGLMTDLPGIFVSHRFGVDAYAIYAVGMFLGPLVTVCTEPFNATILRPISELQQRGDRLGILRLVALNTSALAALLLPMCALFVVAGRDWITVLFTSRYSESWQVLLVSLVSLPFRVVITDPVIRGYFQHRFFPLKVRVFTLLVLCVALWLVPVQAGLVGMIWAVVVLFCIDKLIEITKVWRLLGVRWLDLRLFRDVATIASAAAVAGAVAGIVNAVVADLSHPLQRALLTSGVLIAVYALLLLWAGVVSLRDAIYRIRAFAGWPVPETSSSRCRTRSE